jgi:MFS transporter, DHA1 family, solute carrier family 18 (vesicular amine transporter), member 1/2
MRTTPTSQARPLPRRRAVVAVAVAAVTIDTALLGLIAPLLPEIERRTGASEGALGASFAAYAVPIVFLSLALGRLADSRGRRELVIAGLLLAAAGSAVIAASESLYPLMLGRAIQGFGSAASWIAALSLVSDLAPPGKRGEAIGFALAATGAGSIAGPALGGVTADLISFAAPFLIVCGLSVALALAAAAVLPPESQRRTPQTLSWAAIWGPIGSGIGAVATAMTLGAAGALGLIEVVAPLDFHSRLDLSSAGIGLLFAGSIAVDAALAPLGGRWGDRRGRRGPAATGLALTAASALLLAWLGGALGAALALAVFGAGLSLTFSAAVPWLDEAFGETERGLGYGVLNLLYAAGYTIGPLLGGVLLGVASADAAYGLTAAVLGCGAGTLLLRTSAPTMTARSS